MKNTNSMPGPRPGDAAARSAGRPARIFGNGAAAAKLAKIRRLVDKYDGDRVSAHATVARIENVLEAGG